MNARTLVLWLGLSLAGCDLDLDDPDKQDQADAVAGPDIQIECAQRRAARTFGALPKGVGDTAVDVQCLKRNE